MGNRYTQALSDNHTLEVFLGDEAVFTSSGHWLHPLFDLEDFIKANKPDVSCLSLHDSVQGRAAASLTVRMGITKVKSNLLSALALDIYKKAGVSVIYDTLVPKIACKTEELITDNMTQDEIYAMLRQRARGSVTEQH